MNHSRQGTANNKEIQSSADVGYVPLLSGSRPDSRIENERMLFHLNIVVIKD